MQGFTLLTVPWTAETRVPGLRRHRNRRSDPNLCPEDG